MGGGEMGALPAAEGSGAVDVSAEGTLVWLRRPNGSWWPSIVISPLDVPDGCPAPPRCPAVPIMLLGRRDGSTYVDWCNLERCKRVKPFRCGELDFEHRITNAQALSAARPRCKGRYARVEDAILQALEIERARALHNIHHSPSPKKKRKTPYDSEDEAPTKGSRRMRDLSDIGIGAPPPLPDLLSDATALNIGHHLPTSSLVTDHQAKRSKHAHAATKRKQHLDQPCATSRKKDRSRPLSELCNGDAWNGFTANSNGHLMGTGASSSGSSGTSTLGASIDKTCSPRRGTDRPKLTRVSSVNGSLSDDSPHLHDFVKPATPAAPRSSILEPDHWTTSQPCASPKYLTWKHPKQTTDYSKADLSSHCERDDFKVRTIGSIHQEGSNRTRNTLGHKHHKTKTVNQKEAKRNEVVPLEKKPAKLSLSKPSESGDNMYIAVVPADLDSVGAVQQQHSQRNRDLRESSGTMSNSSNCENGSVSSLVYELPLQTLPPLKRALDLETCRAVKPIKTLQLNPALYDVELSARGISSNGRRVPLVSLMSTWNHKAVVGYPISVEVSDDVFRCLLSNTDVATSIADGVVEKGNAGGLPSSQYASQTKPKSRRKTTGKEMDKLWQPHTKKVASCSPRKMRRLSSFASNHDSRKSLVGKISGPIVACIPLRVVFSRIKEALSCPPVK